MMRTKIPMRMRRARGAQRGASTQSHDQVMTPQSRRVMKMRARIPRKGNEPVVAFDVIGVVDFWLIVLVDPIRFELMTFGL